MSTVKDYKDFIKAHNNKNCPSITGKKKAELKALAESLGYIEPAKKAPAKKAVVKKEPAKKEPVKKAVVKKAVVKKEPVKKEPVKKEPEKKEPVKKSVRIPPTKYAFEPERDLKYGRTLDDWEGYAPYYYGNFAEYDVGMLDIIRKVDWDQYNNGVYFYSGGVDPVLVDKNKTYEENRQIAYNKVYKDYKRLQIEYEKNCRDKFTNKRTKKQCNDLFKHLNPNIFAFTEALEFWKKDPARLKILKDKFSTIYNRYKKLPPIPKNLSPYKGKIPPYNGNRYVNLVGHKDRADPMR